MQINQGFHDECGIVGVFGHKEASNIAYLGLYALQHRGQESAGIVSTDKSKMFVHREMGYVADVFRKEIIRNLTGETAIGHVRYSTQGGSTAKNAQPVVVSCWRGSLALSHNGNIINARKLRDDLERKGSIFQATTDSEVILHLIAKAPDLSLEDALITALQQVKGAYSILLLTPSKMIAVRDPHGFRPLVIGKLDGASVIASETCALDLINAEYVREIQPGEVCVITANGITSYFPFQHQTEAMCIFELIYFSRPDSIVFGESVYSIRKRFGHLLANEHPVDADVVIPVPDSGIVAAIGYSEESKIPYEMALIRNHYIGRTFIEPTQSIRDFGVKLKLNPIQSVIRGKKVVVIDDSIVRGTTSKKLVRMIRNAGASEVHFRISSPPTIGPCRYGIDTPTDDELIANTKSVDEIKEFIGADSLGFLSVNALLSATEDHEKSYCLGCFTRDYPVQFKTEEIHQPRLFEL